MAERITGHTELIGLMAYPIRHSSSPAMHNEAFAYLGLDYAYLAFEVDNNTLEDAVKGIRALKLVGSNVSMPNKTVVGQYLDKLSPAAELCGAVNTIVNENGVLTGHITDGIGFMQALKDNDIDVIGKKMTIAGAGGAATAIEIQAALDGVKEISIFNIHDKFWANAEETVRKINEKTDCKATLYDLDDKEKLREEMADSYIFVNGTGVGMKPLEGMSVVPDKSFFRPELIVIDVPYSPLETTMRKMAKEVGCKTMNGLGMMFMKLLTNRAQIFADVRTYWSPEAVKKATGYDLEGVAKEAGGFLHLINSGAACLDANGEAKDENGNAVMKQWWDITEEDQKAIMDNTEWCMADNGYFRGGGYSSRYETKAQMPATMIRLNLVKGLGPVLQIAEGWTVALPAEVSDKLWKRTDYTWPCTWFAPRCDGKEGPFKTAYDVMNNWGANHGAISYGHIGADLITMCSMLRIPVSMHNVPEKDIYRPAAWNAFGMDKEGADFRACKNYGPLYK